MSSEPAGEKSSKRAVEPQSPGRRRIIGLLPWLALGVIVVVAGADLLRSLREDTGSMSRCTRNLRQIGQAARLYASDHGGSFPDGVEGLLAEGLDPKVFVCPESGDTPARRGKTTQMTAANVMADGHFSFVYLGKGWKAADPKGDMVLAYEPLSNHRGQGSNVLYGDGSGKWLQLREAQKMIDELNSGHNPPQAEKLK